MNATNKFSSCTSNIPWWTTFVLPCAVFVSGISIAGSVNIKKHFNQCTSKKKKILAAKFRRKSRLLSNLSNDSFVNIDKFIEENEITFYKSFNLKLFCEKILSQGTVVGQIMNNLHIGCHLFSFCVYVIFTQSEVRGNYLKGDCYQTKMNAFRWIDFILNLFCTLHFTLRVFASNYAMEFWMNPTTLIDIFVIPNVLMTSCLDFRHQGLSFLRIFYLRNLSDVIIRHFRMKSNIEMVKLILYIISSCMISSGIFLMFEAIGNFWAIHVYHQQISFFNSFYFMMITVATIGYGDKIPKTKLGQIVICLIIIYVLTIFITTLRQMLNRFPKDLYNDKYKNRKGEKQIIVSGKFDYSSITTFFNSFKYSKLRNKTTNVVLMGSEPCENKLKKYIKSCSSKIYYFVGSPMLKRDLKRVAIKKAKMAVVLKLPYTLTNNEDFDNIMTAISLKARQEKIRTIVQLQSYSNKILLKMFPIWNITGQDIIICFDELKLGLISYSCLVPGIATLILNLFTCSNREKTSKSWQKDYEEGLQNRLFTIQFSEDFHGMHCLDVAMIMYRLWDVCLLAIKDVSQSESDFVIINPMIENFKINSNTMLGIIIARNESATRHILRYCSNCAKINHRKTCQCFTRKVSYRLIRQRNVTNKYVTREDSSLTYSTSNCSEFDYNINIDETGSFYWTLETKFDKLCLEVEEAEMKQISEHILVCLCGSGNEIFDLSNFMMPLRCTLLQSNELRTIVFLGKKSYFKNSKWTNLKNFPLFFIINGSPNQARDLRAAGLFNCYKCIIINGNTSSNIISDKNSIICATLIESMLNCQNKNLNLMIEIRRDEIVHHFTIDKSGSYDINVSVQHTEPFARGLIFANSIFYNLIYHISQQPDTFSFIKTLLCGPYADKIENVIGSGVGILQQKQFASNLRISGAIFKLFMVSEPPFNLLSRLTEILRYGDLFEWALREKRILCLGLYRKNLMKFRYVYTHPEKSTQILLTDKIYCCLNST